MFKELKHLQKMGCNESGAPEKYSERDLSAVHDALLTIQQTLGEKAGTLAWETLPMDFRMDYNWSFWRYHKKK